jgi:hypothetical protein
LKCKADILSDGIHAGSNMPIHYHKQEAGKRRVDFVVEGKGLVKLKAVIKIE